MLLDIHTSWSKKNEYELSGLTTKVYKWGWWSVNTVSSVFNFKQCFSVIELFLGLLCLIIKWTLEVGPHLSGPNMIEYGVLSLNCIKSLIPGPSVSNFKYAPPQVWGFWKATSYWITKVLPLSNLNGLSSFEETAAWRLSDNKTRPLSPFKGNLSNSSIFHLPNNIKN